MTKASFKSGNTIFVEALSVQ